MSEELKPCSSFKDSFSQASDDVKESTNKPLSQASDGVEESSSKPLCEGSDSVKEPFSESFNQGSGDAEESFCEPCKSMGKHVAVEGYCETCPEYLCKHCLVVHRNQKLTRGHSILDKNHMPGGQGSDTIQGLCVKVCETHQPELLRFYCHDHDQAACRDCAVLTHNKCTIDRVQDVCGGFQATKDFELIQENLANLLKELEVMNEKLGGNQKNMDTIYNDIQCEITSFRKHVNNYLDQIEKQITEEAAEMKEKYDTEMNKVVAINDAMKSELEDILARLQKDLNMNENSVFVFSKQAKQTLAKMEKELTRIEQSQQRLQQQQSVFRRSIEIENLVTANTPLGKLLRKPHINTTASYRGKIDVKTMKGMDICINDCTLLGPDRMIITTNEGNDNMKLIDIPNKTVISSYTTSATPWAITVVCTNQVAVTVPDERKIQLFNVPSTSTKQHESYQLFNALLKPSFSKLYEIQLDHVCQGVAYADGKLAVSYGYPGCIEIMDKQGQVLHRIQPKQGIEEKIRGPQYIIFGHNKDTVIASYDSTNKVRVLTFEGQILHTYTHDVLTAPRGLVMTPDGVVFVCSSWKNGNIHSVSPDFKTSKVIINKTEHEGRLTCVTYCDTNHKLYVCKIPAKGASPGKQGKGNKIIIYDLNV